MEVAGVFVYRDIWTGLLLRKLVDAPQALVACGQVCKQLREWVISSKAVRMASHRIIQQLPRHFASKVRRKRYEPWLVCVAVSKALLRRAHFHRLEDLAARDALDAIGHSEICPCLSMTIVCDWPQDTTEPWKLTFILVKRYGTDFRVVETCSNKYSPHFASTEVVREFLAVGVWRVTCGLCNRQETLEKRRQPPRSFQHLFWRKTIPRRAVYTDDDDLEWMVFLKPK
jgi:hypothetical protein